jgi:small subunit ribosomal protein S17
MINSKRKPLLEIEANAAEWLVPKLRKEQIIPAQLSQGRKEVIGEVVSSKMAKTIVVQVVRQIQHPRYQRVIRRRKKFYAHDEAQTAKEGDVVCIEETRPLSKLKRWNLVKVIRSAPETTATREIPEFELVS